MNRAYKWYLRMHKSKSMIKRRGIEVIMRVIFSCDIPPSAQIGDNCSFAHNALGVVIHGESIIGDNCHIGHNVTIGGRAGITKVPVIGDNVLIGANSLILGPITIGNNVKIGAGSVVVNDVPDGATVIPTPSRIIDNKGK